MKKNELALTLIELIFVVLVAVMLAVLAIPNYRKSKDRALQKEVFSSLKLIAAAERVYKMERGHYYPPSGTASGASLINANLKLQLVENNWTYAIDYGVTTPSVTTVTGTKGSCVYTVNSNNSFNDDPSKGASCS